MLRMAVGNRALWGCLLSGPSGGGEGWEGSCGIFVATGSWRGLAGAPISMDGVFAMQPFYASGGFVFTHRNLRMEGVGCLAAERDPHLVDLVLEVPFDEVVDYDERLFGSRDRIF